MTRAAQNDSPLRVVDLIVRKRNGGTLDRKEIDAFVQGVCAGSVPDYQTAALLMAIFFRGLDPSELLALTQAMLHSGDVLDFSDLALPKVDKHSTGGVGDKISLALAPAVAAAGLAVPMIAGRGLGLTGGTLDKLESIPGFRTRLEPEEFGRLLRKHGFVFGGQSERLAPADRILYALRDVTATVESIPLIASSILSKKLAEGISGLVLDVKVGKGAFMKSEADARTLARTMVELGRGAGTRTVALLTRMDEPIGLCVGNACEVWEAVEVLRGGGPPDTRELTLALGAEMLVLGGQAPDARAGERKIDGVLQDGSAFARFRDIVAAQGGDPGWLDRPPAYAEVAQETRATESGYLSGIDSAILADVVMSCGGGRSHKDEKIDPGIALILHQQRGDRVERDQPLCTLHTREKRPDAARRLPHAFQIGDTRPQPVSRVLERIE